MKIGETANDGAAKFGKPLDGVRILAAEQMQALPYATQLLARLGADVIKVEHPNGESGRTSTPFIEDPQGRMVGATFLRNNLGKRSLSLDLKSDRGREIFTALAGNVDIVAENFKSGTMDRMGLGFEALSEIYPSLVYVSVSGFGNTTESPYAAWPAYASIAEAMSGLYDYQRRGHDVAPVSAPAGALGDISSALFAVIGLQAALMHRDKTGLGQYVDVAMFDSMISMSDVVTNFWSLGVRPDPDKMLEVIMSSFRCADGWFVLQIVREHQFVKLAELIGHPEWITDPRFQTRAGWSSHLEDEIRPAIELWASHHGKVEVSHLFANAGLAAGPCLSAPEVISDPHVTQRNMMVEMERPDGVAEPVLTPGNPIKMSRVTEGPETRVPWVGEHTDEILSSELGLSDDELADLRSAGVIA